MIAEIQVVFTIVWPFVAAWLFLKLAPAALTKFVEKEIDRRSDAQLERIKAELQGSYSTLKTSVDVLSASNSGMHPHIIEAVSALWAAMVAMRENFGAMIAFDSISTPEEAQEAFSQRKHLNLLEFVRPFEGEMHKSELIMESNASKYDNYRLFCGDKLWLMFYIYRGVLMRNAYLISESFKDSAFRHWGQDKGMEQLLGAVIANDEVEQFRERPFGGLSLALTRLEGEFLHEATRVMSGSKAMADSLADMQAMMLLQNAKVAEQGSGT